LVLQSLTMRKLLANENFPYSSVVILRNAGFDVLSISEEHSGITDNNVIEIAIKENRTILTFDKDYGELVFKYGYQPSQGIIYFRLEEFTPHEPGVYLVFLLTNLSLDVNGSLTVIEKNMIRQRKYV